MSKYFWQKKRTSSYFPFLNFVPPKESHTAVTQLNEFEVTSSPSRSIESAVTCQIPNLCFCFHRKKQRTSSYLRCIVLERLTPNDIAASLAFSDVLMDPVISRLFSCVLSSCVHTPMLLSCIVLITIDSLLLGSLTIMMIMVLQYKPYKPCFLTPSEAPGKTRNSLRSTASLATSWRPERLTRRQTC